MIQKSINFDQFLINTLKKQIILVPAQIIEQISIQSNDLCKTSACSNRIQFIFEDTLNQ